MKIYILLFAFFNFLCAQCQESNENDFLSMFNEMSFNKKIKIINTTNTDYFKGNLSKCNALFYTNLFSNTTYYMKGRCNDIVVVEYVYSDMISCDLAYKRVNEYANLTLNMNRLDFKKRCYDIMDEQVYYSHRKGKHIYLITFLNNIYFKTKDKSINDFFKNNKEVLIDELNEQLAEKCL